MASLPSLSAVQAQFHALVTAPESVARTLADRGLGPGALTSLVTDDGQLSAVDRLEIYAGMYFFRILDVLRDAYPQVAAALGGSAFHDLVTEYLVACPPAHPSIVNVGDRLPAFLARSQVAADKPWLVPMARLERALVELFDGPDAEPISLEALRRLPPGRIADLRLALVPCHAILEPEGVLVWRQDVSVYHRAIDAHELPLLLAVEKGSTIAALCDLASDGKPVADAARNVFDLVARWATDGLLRNDQDAAE